MAAIHTETETDVQLQVLLKRLETLLSIDGSVLDNDEELLNNLKRLVANVQWSSKDVTELFFALLKRFELTPRNERAQLHSWMMKVLHSIEINYVTPGLKIEIKKEDVCTKKTVVQLVSDTTIADDDLLKHLDHSREKELDEILDEIREQEFNQTDKELLEKVKDIVSSVDKCLVSPNCGSHLDDSLPEKKLLYDLCQAVHETQKFRPRLTQMVSWCLMALSKSGWLIQVGTGEGKSCIVAMFAAFRARRGEKVDIFSSSSVLAERDLNTWQGFYEKLNISVDCNTNKHGCEELNTCYKCQVVYGTAEEFAGDWLRHHFQRKNIWGEREFQCAIVDEVDSLMLDKGLHIVYLSNDMPAIQHLNPLLAFIWVTVNQYCKLDAVRTAGPIYPFLHIVLENLDANQNVDDVTILKIAEKTGIIPKGSVQDKIDPSVLEGKIADVGASQMVEFLEEVETKFPSCHFALYQEKDGVLEELNKGVQDDKGDVCRVPLLFFGTGSCRYIYSDEKDILRTAEERIKHHLQFTPCELSQDEIICYVPGFLKDLVNSKLRVWIENAFHAQTMTLGHEYIIEGDGVVPVDYSCTGVVENNMKWSDGLQQFIEMKHQTKFSDMTIITNYMSNVCLLQKYGDQIYGISGTLGQQSETDMLQKLYTSIKTCQIPSFKRRKLFEVEGVITNDEEEWIEKICNVIKSQINPTPFRDPRAVLAICETINRAEALHRALGNHVQSKKLYINNNMDNSAIFRKDLEAGDVIIATNLAGRGTDLKVSHQVNKAGGLFVVQTFLPKNARVEQQAFGRTARQGSPGSAQLIICSEHLTKQQQMLQQMLKHELCSQVEDMVDHFIMSLYQACFLRSFRLYQKSHIDEGYGSMSSALPHILTPTSNSGIKLAKKLRDTIVSKRLSNYLEDDIPKIKKKEELFNLYLTILDGLHKSSSNMLPDSDVSSLNETWGMWLLMNFNEQEPTEDLKKHLRVDMEVARQKLALRKSPSSILHHYTGFGNELRESGKLAESIEMYTIAIQEDHCWAAVAQYNRAFACLARQDQKQDRNCIIQALEDLTKALESVEFYQRQTVTHLKSVLTTKNPLGDTGTRFSEQMRAKCSVLELFKANITEAIKKLERARAIGGDVKVDKKLVYFMALHIFRQQQLMNNPSFDILRELMRLESLGLTCVFTLDTLSSLGDFFTNIFNKFMGI